MKVEVGRSLRRRGTQYSEGSAASVTGPELGLKMRMNSSDGFSALREEQEGSECEG